MNLFELLKQFKTVTPDAGYTEQSKRAILATSQAPKGMRGLALRGVWGIFETALALVLAGFFIILITGDLPGGSSLSPVQYSVIDPAGLKAEAQAVDMQIQLASIQYSQTTSSASTAAAANAHPSVAAPVKPSGTLNRASALSASSTPATSTGSAAATSTDSLDEALQALSQ